jgi:resuscitation-promoting factor RpfB
MGLLLCLALLLSGCAAATPTAPSAIQVNIRVDGQPREVQIPSGSTVQYVLDTAGITLGNMDRIEPPVYTVLEQGSQVRVVRITESYRVEEEIIPFERQTLRNESLPLDNEIYLQRGKNGLAEITYRQVFEDGMDTTKPVPVKRVIVEEPVAEIVMIGVQAPFSSIAIPGRLVYLRDGNAWMMTGDTGNRRAIVTTGDLDGRVLVLSPDGHWLLFTRASQSEGQINGLWAMKIDGPGSGTPGKLLDLTASNIVHFADWITSSGTTLKAVFSTVEPRSAAPGWQANNDLFAMTFSPSGWISRWQNSPVLEANSGGVYGWWGTTFGWAPDGEHLAYARPDGIGLLNFESGEMTSLAEILPLQTRGDWAWTPGFSWAPDGQFIFAVDHAPSASSPSPEESALFDLVAIPGDGGQPIRLASNTGMFAYPLASPVVVQPTGELAYEIAYLQAIFPDQSETSRYRVMVMDRDGSDRRVLFPSQEHSSGLAPQQNWGSWSPEKLPGREGLALALIYGGNLWIVDSETGQAYQITGDGLTTRVVWHSD